MSGAFKRIKWSSFDSEDFTQFTALERQMFKLPIILITWGRLNRIDLEAEHDSLFVSLETSQFKAYQTKIHVNNTFSNIC